MTFQKCILASVNFYTAGTQPTLLNLPVYIHHCICIVPLQCTTVVESEIKCLCIISSLFISCLFVFQRQRLIRESGQGGSPVKSFGSGGIENGGSVDRPLEDGGRLERDGGVKAADNLQPEEEDDGDEVFRPLHVPGQCKPQTNNYPV